MTTPDRDQPVRHHDTLSSAFLGFLARGELRVARDLRTGAWVEFLKSLDRRADDLEWIPASGRATLELFVVYRRQYHPDFPTPYNVALVALEEGPHLVSTVLAGSPI